jgi:hypothetical protein
VELEIKRDKSLGGLSKLPNFRPDTIATWLQAKTLIQLMARKIASLAEAFPPRSPTGTFAPSQTSRSHHLALRVAREAWRVTSLVSAAIRAALRFVPLHRIKTVIGTFLDHLGQSNETTRPKQIELFQQQLQPVPG